MSFGDKFKDTQAERLRDLLHAESIPTQQFIVPRFQRHYSWKDKEFESLWSDIYENYVEYKDKDPNMISDAQYMLGPIVLVHNKKAGMEWHVIDGQQRLATLTTLFCVIRDLASEFINEKSADNTYQLTKLLTERHDGEPKLLLNQKDRDFFYNRIQKEGNPLVKLNDWKNDTTGKNKQDFPASQKNLMKCYKFFYEKICDALLAEFVDQNDIDKKVDDDSAAIKKSILDRLLTDPTKYKLTNDFFDGHWHNTKFSFDPNKITKHDREKFRKTMKDGRRATKFDTVEKFVEHVVAQKEKKVLKIVKQLTDEEKNRSARDSYSKNFPLLQKFLEHVVRENFVVSVKVRDESDAFMIFETLNARSVQLSKSDLVKNLCLGIIRDEEEIASLDERWNAIFDNELKSGDSFIRESLRSRCYDEYALPTSGNTKRISATTANLFRIIKHQLNNDKDEVRNYIKGLEQDAEFVKIIDTPQGFADNESIREALIGLNRLDAVAVRIPLLTAYRRWRFGDEFVGFLEFLVKFHFRNRTIGQTHPSKIEKNMLSVAKSIGAGDSLYNIKKSLKDNDIIDEDFSYYFEHYQSDDPDIAKYILWELEKHVRSKKPLVQLAANVTLEHILPQCPDNTWSKEDFGGSDDGPRWYHPYRNRIGNLTLLSRGINSSVKNKSFCVKKTKAYNAEDDLVLTKSTVVKMPKNIKNADIDNANDLDDVDEWTADIIKRRSTYFANLANEIWDLSQL